MASSPPVITSAIRTGQSVKSAPARATCWIPTIHKVGAEPELYTIELNDTANDVTEQIIKGDIAIIKHTDDGETQIETPESGAGVPGVFESCGQL